MSSNNKSMVSFLKLFLIFYINYRHTPYLCHTIEQWQRKHWLLAWAYSREVAALRTAIMGGLAATNHCPPIPIQRYPIPHRLPHTPHQPIQVTS